MVDNRGGGASQVGTQAIATAPPDGYTIGMIDSAFTINPGLFAGKLPYDTLQGPPPISLIATAPLVFVVHPSCEGEERAGSGCVGEAETRNDLTRFARPRHAGALAVRAVAPGRPASISSRCRIAAPGRRSRTSSPGRCR